MTETWLDATISEPMISIDGYKILRHDRNRHGGGICVHFRKDLVCRIVRKSSTTSLFVERSTTEYLLLEIQCGSERFLLGIYYNPPNVDCSETLFNHLDEYKVKYDSTFFLGDFNTDLLKSSSRSRRFKDVLSSLAYSSVNSEPTFYHQTGCSLLDLLITDRTDLVLKNDQVSMPGISNHDMVFCSLDFTRLEQASTVLYRDYSNFDSRALHEGFLRLDWNDFLIESDSDQLLNTFNSRLRYLHDEFIPLRKRRIKNNPWFNNDIQLAIVNRDIAYRTWKHSKLTSDELHYRRLRNKANDLIKKAKNSYDKSKINLNLPCKELWKNIKNLGVTKHNAANHNLDFTANEINDYFSSNFTTNSTINTILYESEGGFNFRTVYDYEIVNAIFSIRSNAVGLDNIPIRFIKIMLPLILPIVTHLFNTIISTSKFPCDWKCVKVIPIKKKSNSSEMSNLRPISLLSALSKAFEKIIETQISCFINDSGLLSPFQSGFRKQHSTNSALLQVHDDIAKAIDKKGIAILLLIDFSKAFDRVSHAKLLTKLSTSFRFTCHAKNLVKSYLHGRSQAVYSNEITSSFRPIWSGVPQGSVLGPLLFTLFINDLPSVLQYCSVHLFADDVQIYFCAHDGSSMDEIARKMNRDLAKIFRWSQSNLLPINPSKTKALLFSRSKNPTCCPQLYINNDSIEFVDHADNLGIIFKSNLEWDFQINAQCGKIYGSLKRLNLTTRHLDIATKTKLFKTLIFPHFIYGDFIYTNASMTSLNRLRVALNACVRYVYNLSSYSRVSHLQKNLIGCPFSQFYKFRSCTILFKIVSSKKPEYLYTKLTPLRNSRTRSFLIPQHSSAYYSQSFFARGIVYWNQLPISIKSNVTKYNFKRDLLAELNRTI